MTRPFLPEKKGKSGSIQTVTMQNTNSEVIITWVIVFILFVHVQKIGIPNVPLHVTKFPDKVKHVFASSGSTTGYPRKLLWLYHILILPHHRESMFYTRFLHTAVDRNKATKFTRDELFSWASIPLVVLESTASFVRSARSPIQFFHTKNLLKISILFFFSYT